MVVNFIEYRVSIACDYVGVYSHSEILDRVIYRAENSTEVHSVYREDDDVVIVIKEHTQLSKHLRGLLASVKLAVSISVSRQMKED